MSQVNEMNAARIVKFNGTNFQLWKFSIVIVLKANDLMEVILDTKPALTGTNTEEIKKWEKKNNQAMVFLLSSINEDQLSYLVNCETAADMWKKLITVHDQKTEVSKHMVYQKFYKLQMTSGQKVAAFISEVESVVKQLKDMDENISDVAVISKIINSLPHKFAMLVTAWDSVDPTKQTLPDLIAKLLKEEQKLSVDESNEDNLALQTQSLKLQGVQKNNARKKKSIEELKKKSKCGHCKKTCHWWRECPSRKPASSGSNLPRGINIKRRNEALTCDIIQPFKNISDDDQNVWLADTGASVHMSFRREWFKLLKPIGNEVTVRVADNKTVKAEGIGDIEVQAYIENVWETKTITDVLYIPELRRNLLSVGKMTGKGFTMVAKSDQCEFYNPEGQLSCVGIRRGNMFKMLMKTEPPEFECNVSMKDSLKLWHERLGHVNIKYVKDAIKNSVAEGAVLEDESEFFCEGCQLGKQN